jgi:hypothetical protein
MTSRLASALSTNFCDVLSTRNTVRGVLVLDIDTSNVRGQGTTLQ